jgi:DNA-binding transcriptional LysR family regulator
MDRYAGMTVFVRVVESGSFIATARQFAISPTMVSTHIQALEKHLGVRLLNRTTRRVSATEVGRNYYEDCLRILHKVEEAERAAGDLQAAPRGRIRLTAPMTFGIRQLGPLIADYLKTYPDVSINLSLDDRKIDLLEEGFDLAIHVGELADSSLIARHVTSAPAMLCASRDYVGKYGAPKTPRDLLRHDCLAYASSGTRAEWRFIGPGGVEESVTPSGRFLANNGDALRKLALRGLGIILAPKFIVEADLEAGNLIALMPDYNTSPFPFHAVYPHSRYLSATVKTFVDFLVARFGRPSCSGTKRVILAKDYSTDDLQAAIDPSSAFH